MTISCNYTETGGLALAGIAAECHDSGAVLTKGEEIAWRRNRLGWKQSALADRAGVSHSTVLRVEKDRPINANNLRAIVDALEAGEAEQSITSLGLDMTQGGRIGSALTLLQPSLETTRPRDLSRQGGEYQSEFPRGADAPESAADARIRELERQLDAEKTAHAEMRGLAAKLTGIIATRLESLEARLPAPRRSKRR